MMIKLHDSHILEKDNVFTVHDRNIQSMDIKIFKFHHSNNLRSKYDSVVQGVHTAHNRQTFAATVLL